MSVRKFSWPDADPRDQLVARCSLWALAMVLACFTVFVGQCNSNQEEHREGTARELQIEKQAEVERVKACGSTDDPRRCLRDLELAEVCGDLLSVDREKTLDCVRALVGSEVPE